MERILDDSDALRRAEEIYSRKRGITTEKKIEKKFFSIYKFLFQFLVLINLAILILSYQNRNWIFSEEFLKKVDEIYNINITARIENFLSDGDIKDSNKENNHVDEESSIKEENSQISNEISNIEKIKEGYSFEIPIRGTITSFFGNRESNNSNISGFHSGIDISAITGSKIKSAHDGIVVLVSSNENYR